MISKKDINLLKEIYNITCTYCGSSDWEPAGPLDYVKKCKSCDKIFSTYPPQK